MTFVAILMTRVSDFLSLLSSRNFLRTNMDIIYSHLYRTEAHHWWYAGRRKIVFDRIIAFLSEHKNARILDVGCGTGYNIQCLKQHKNIETVGLDISREALNFCLKRGVTQLVDGNCLLLPFSNNSFDMILMLDVIEQVKNDLSVLKEQARILKTGGMLVIFTPAFEHLWSFHDDMNHHVRRYKIDDLQRKVQLAGLTIHKLTYANTFLFPFILAVRTIERLTGRPGYITTEDDLHPSWTNTFLKYIFTAESSLLNHINFPYGVSLLCIAKK